MNIRLFFINFTMNILIIFKAHYVALFYPIKILCEHQGKPEICLIHSARTLNFIQIFYHKG